MALSLQNRVQTPRLPTPVVRRELMLILTALGCRAQGGMPELSVVLTGDPQIQRLNGYWRHKDRPTDVLSFSQLEQGFGDVFCSLNAAPPVWGDIVISYDTAMRQAHSFGHSLAFEVRVLLVHGILHLLGYEHEHDAKKAARMRAQEALILAAVRTMDLKEPSL